MIAAYINVLAVSRESHDDELSAWLDSIAIKK